MIYADTQSLRGVEDGTLRSHSASVPPGPWPHPLYFFFLCLIPAHFAHFLSAGKEETGGEKINTVDFIYLFLFYCRGSTTSSTRPGHFIRHTLQLRKHMLQS